MKVKLVCNGGLYEIKQYLEGCLLIFLIMNNSLNTMKQYSFVKILILK
jgi:hypothetical protein